MPWTAYWDRNYFAQSLPFVQVVLRNNFVRGAVSGIGFISLCAGFVDLGALLPWRRR